MPKRQTTKRTVKANPYQENTEASAPSEPAAAGSTARPPKMNRVPIHQAGGRRNLDIADDVIRHFDDLGFHLCWVNDDRGGVQKYKRAGYEFVNQNELPDGYEIGDPDVSSGNTSLDSTVSRIAGKNHIGNAPMFVRLMKQPLEFYLEDCAESQKKPDEIDKAIYRGASTNQDGEQRSVDNSYGRVEYR